MTKRQKDSPLLKPYQLLDLAGERSFQRGRDYFEEGRVEDLLVRGDTATATVAGSRDYRVRLELGSEGIEGFDCTCPVGRDGEFCKHCVAAGLAFISEGLALPTGQRKKSAKRAKDKVPTWDEVVAHVESMDQRRLAELVIGAAKKDDALYRLLVRETASTAGAGAAAAACRSEIEAAFHTGGFVDYDEAGDFAHGLEEAVDSLEVLLDKGFPAEAAELAAFALAKLDRVLEYVDDSDGECGILNERIAGIHHRACLAAKPDPRALAEGLFRMEMNDRWGWIDHTVRVYADALGEEGVRAFRALVEKEWAKAPSRSADAKRDSYGTKGHRLQGMMEDLARLSGDVEALVAIKSRDLSSPYAFYEIATAYQEAGQEAKGTEWAEKGVRAFPTANDPRLLDFLAEAYLKGHRAGEAMDLIWQQFEASPWLDLYEKLKDFAKRAKAWPAWRERALSFLREKVQKDAGRRKGPWERAADASRLVEILLWEKDPETAWKEAKAGGCSDSLWLELAKAREKDFPEDALEVHERLAEAAAGRKNNRAYEECKGHVLKVKALLERLGRRPEFVPFLNGLMTRHKPKRNLMKLLASLDRPGRKESVS